jgi:hypothetical protein
MWPIDIYQEIAMSNIASRKEETRCGTAAVASIYS